MVTMERGTITETVIADVFGWLKANPNKTIPEIAEGTGHTPSRVKNALYANQDKFEKRSRVGRYLNTWAVQ